MGVAKPGAESHTGDVLRHVIRDELRAMEASGNSLAATLGIDSGTISRTINGGIRMRLDRLLEIERAMGKRKGYLLRAAGLVDDERTPRECIEDDPHLSPAYREMVLASYDSAAGLSERMRASSDATSVSPSTAKKRRS